MNAEAHVANLSRGGLDLAEVSAFGNRLVRLRKRAEPGTILPDAASRSQAIYLRKDDAPDLVAALLATFPDAVIAAVEGAGYRVAEERFSTAEGAKT